LIDRGFLPGRSGGIQIRPTVQQGRKTKTARSAAKSTNHQPSAINLQSSIINLYR